jgi:hypothetical protein
MLQSLPGRGGRVPRERHSSPPPTIRKWYPPHTFVAGGGGDGADETEQGPGNVATEWTVEARAGRTCEVRVVHRWFARTDDWDGEFEGHA